MISKKLLKSSKNIKIEIVLAIRSLNRFSYVFMCVLINTRRGVALHVMVKLFGWTTQNNNADEKYKLSIYSYRAKQTKLDKENSIGPANYNFLYNLNMRKKKKISNLIFFVCGCKCHLTFLRTYKTILFCSAASLINMGHNYYNPNIYENFNK